VPATDNSHFVHSGGKGLTNTVPRAELTGIIAAMQSGCTHIATDSACSLSQIRKQLRHPMLHSHHIHGTLLKIIIDIAKRFQDSECPPIHLYKVKAHVGIIGNECADAIAKLSAQCDTGHDTFFPIEGNPYKHRYWLAATAQPPSHNAPSARPAAATHPPADADDAASEAPETPSHLTYLSNLGNNLKDHMHAQHKLGSARTDTVYFSMWQRLAALASMEESNAFMSNPAVSFKEKRNILQVRTGTLYTQQHAVWFKRVVGPPLCPLCRQPDSIIHILSGCQHQTIRCQVTERHNIADRLIYEALSKGALGAGVVFSDVGSDSRIEQQGTAAPANNRTLPTWLFPSRMATWERSELCSRSSRPDLILVDPHKAPPKRKRPQTVMQPRTRPTTRASARAAIAEALDDEGEEPDIDHAAAALQAEEAEFERAAANEAASAAAADTRWRLKHLPASGMHVHLVEIKYCDDTRPEPQLEAARQQHLNLIANP